MIIDTHGDKYYTEKEVVGLLIRHTEQSTTDPLKQVDELRRENEKWKNEYMLTFNTVAKLGSDNAVLQSQLSQANERVKELEEGLMAIRDGFTENSLAHIYAVKLLTKQTK